ncbi:hypothetical protein OIDMADRAFT_67317, partial [Oidiodendron maius Zn]
SSSSNITDSEDRPWYLIGEAKDHLLAELEQLYWAGVEHELESVLETLKTWQSHRLSEITLVDESDNFVHGFDTFIDQVSEESREFADQVRMMKDQVNPSANQGYILALEQSAQGVITEQKSSQLKAEIRQALGKQESESLLRRRTRMLLQAIGLLDIEKLVEHRPPLDNLSFWKRPAVPQLQLHAYSKTGMPILTSLRCSSCESIIRSSMYCKQSTETRGKKTSAEQMCEDCYREKAVDKPEFVKVYKHSILNEIITPRISRKICLCENVPHYDSQGKNLTLFPVSKDVNHRKAHMPGMVECGLFKLGEIVAEAKYNGMRIITSRKKQKQKKQMQKNKRNLAGERREDNQRVENMKQKQAHRPKTITQQSQQAPERATISGTTVAVEEAEAHEDIPFFLRRYTEKYPFGNVHMALRIGPVVIENGVAQCLALNENPTRQIWWQDRPRGKPKRFKSIMKQVIGSPFTGLLDKSLETGIIDGLVAASKALDNDELSPGDRAEWLKCLLEPMIKDLKVLIGSQLSIYLESIVSHLLDPKTSLRWTPMSNNCQNFCDALIDIDIFGSLTAAPSPINDRGKSGPKLYLLSFVCRPAGYTKPEIKSKFDVPRGLTEEYLLRFRYGRHDEADIIDTLQEYWHDWGTFGKHLYKYQDLFPWDCTEAFGRYPVTCGDCNLAKHVWAFPFDSWSTISLHLTRDRYNYPPDDDKAPMTDIAWMRNRLLVLCAQEKLILAAAAMTGNASFRARTAWLHNQVDPAKDRLKLGGIHRAQPFSHTYDEGKYQHYFVASWAHLKLEDKVAEYELLRDGRVKLPDVEF